MGSEEIFDITDENGFVTGKTVARSEAHEKGIMHRTAHIWIVRKGGQSYQVKKGNFMVTKIHGCRKNKHILNRDSEATALF